MGIGNAELPFLALGLGLLICGLTTGVMNATYVRLRKKHGDHPYPEGRLPFAMVAAITCPVSLFWFGWTANKDIHWIVPILSGVPYAIYL